MQRKADDIFRVKDLSMLKSPVPGHVRSNPSTPYQNQKTDHDNSSMSGLGTQQKIFAPSPGIIRPSFLTPKPMMGPPPARSKPSPLTGIFRKEKEEKVTVAAPSNEELNVASRTIEDLPQTTTLVVSNNLEVAVEEQDEQIEPDSIKENSEIVENSNVPDSVAVKQSESSAKPKANGNMLSGYIQLIFVCRMCP